MQFYRQVSAVLSLALFWVAGASANIFNMPAGQTSLQFVSVGDPNNAASPATGRGAVAYSYHIGTFDVTAAQYAQFLNAVAKTDTYGLYTPIMASGYANCGITQSGSSGNFTYTVATGDVNFPVNYVSWGDAARFVNWLTNGQPAGPQGAGTTETGSYALNGAVSNSALMAITRSSNAIYALPTEDEWYKAAYYKGGSTNAGYWLYPTQSNSSPSNTLSGTGANNANYDVSDFTDPIDYLTSVGAFAASPGPYGTFDQGGDVFQWTEDTITDSTRGVRGGAFNTGGFAMNSEFGSYAVPTDHPASTGFRVVLVPEPGLAGALVVIMGLRRKKL